MSLSQIGISDLDERIEGEGEGEGEKYSEGWLLLGEWKFMTAFPTRYLNKYHMLTHSNWLLRASAWLAAT